MAIPRGTTPNFRGVWAEDGWGGVREFSLTFTAVPRALFHSIRYTSPCTSYRNRSAESSEPPMSCDRSASACFTNGILRIVDHVGSVDRKHRGICAAGRARFSEVQPVVEVGILLTSRRRETHGSPATPLSKGKRVSYGDTVRAKEDGCVAGGQRTTSRPCTK